MLFAVICLDKPGALDIRKANRDAHLAYVAATGCVVQAGPFLDGKGEMMGSLVILEVEDRPAAEDWVEDDPYGQADLFDSVTIRPWKKVIG